MWRRTFVGEFIIAGGMVIVAITCIVGIVACASAGRETPKVLETILIMVVAAMAGAMSGPVIKEAIDGHSTDRLSARPGTLPNTEPGAAIVQLPPMPPGTAK